MGNPRNNRIHRNTFPRPRSLDSMSCLSRTQMVGRPRVEKNSSPDRSTHHIVESLMMPDVILRWKIRGGLSGLMAKMDKEEKNYEERVKFENDFVKEIKESPIAIHQDDANDQHYEVPADFFRIVLGPHLEYSSCVFKDESTTLTEAEIDMLELYVERSQMKDGLSLLDLGCGWGSVALFMAARFPKSKVTALSNSSTQKDYIDGEAKKKGLTNLTVYTGDVAVFDDENFQENFDRIISIEMFEHMKNYEKLLKRISTWLNTGGKLFVHIFTHRWKPYHFTDDWMAKTFFTGGTMPSHTLLLNFQTDLAVAEQWGMSGSHYARTLDTWLKRMDANKDLVKPILVKTYGDKWQRWWLNWGLFFLVCSETFGIRDGSEWGVSHYLFTKK